MAKKDTYDKLFNQGGQPPPTAQELSDYLNNRLSPEAQHAFEQRLIDHPMLEEGIEGWQAGNNKDVLSITKSLNRRVRQRTQRGRTTGKLAFWQLAAAVMLLLVGGVALFGVMNQVGKQQESALAEQPTTTEEQKIIPAEAERELPVKKRARADAEKETTEDAITTPQPQPLPTEEEVEELPVIGPEEAEDVTPEEETTSTEPRKQRRSQTPYRLQDNQGTTQPDLTTLSRTALEDRLAVVPSDPLRLEIARRYYAEGQAQLAMVYLQKMQGDEDAPEFAPALLLKAQIWLEHAQDTSRAKVALRRLRTQKPKSPEAQTAQEWLEKLLERR